MFRIIALGLFVGLYSVNALAAPLPAATNRDVLYNFAWSGFTLGSIHLKWDETANDYTIRADAESGGLANIFSRHRSHSEASGTRGNDYKPAQYRSYYQTKKKKKSAELQFGANGAIKTEKTLPAGNAADRSAINATDKINLFDPLSMLMEIRRQTLAHQGKGNFTFRLYDGTRLMNVKVELQGKENLSIAGNPIAVQHLAISRTQLGGFTEKELKKMKTEPTLHLYLSDDASLLPIKLEVTSGPGTLVGYLAQDCVVKACNAFQPMTNIATEWKTALGN